MVTTPPAVDVEETEVIEGPIPSNFIGTRILVSRRTTSSEHGVCIINIRVTCTLYYIINIITHILSI